MDEVKQKMVERLPVLKFFNFDVVEASEGKVALRLYHERSIERSGGIVFGGVISLFFDALLGTVVRTVNDVGDQATISLSVEFLRPAKEWSYTFEGYVVKKGKNIVFVEGKMIGDDSGKLLAKASGVWFLKKKI